MLWFKRKNKIRKIKGRTEEDFAAIEISNLVKIKGIVTPSEVKQVCHGMSEKQVSKVIKKLKSVRIVMVNGLLQYSKDIVGDDEMRDNELKQHITARDYPNVTSDSMRIGTRFYEGIVATGFPEIAKSDWLNRLLKEKENMDFSVFIVPEQLRNLEVYLRQQLKQVESEIFKLNELNKEDKKLEDRKKELQLKLDNISNGKYLLFKISLYILNKGVNEEKTKGTSKRIMSFLHSDGIEGKYATNYQKQLFASVIPSGTDFLGGRQIIANSTTISMSFPFRKR